MATFAQIKMQVAAYMQRSPASFVHLYAPSSVDLLSLAVNQARKWMELERNFELSRVQTELSISLANGSDISGMTLLDGVTAVSVKSIAKAFLPIAGTTDGWFPIEVMSRDKHLERLQRYYDQVTDLTTVNGAQTSLVPYFAVVRTGDLLYLTPNDTAVYGNVDPIDVRFDVFKWLPDYSTDGSTDFLLTHCETFMLLRSAYQLNFFLKDDQRINISNAVMEKEWHSVVAWDSNLVVNSSSDANLD